MKRFTLFQVMTVVLSLVIMSTAQTLSIQGVIRDDTGASVEGTKSITFRLYTSEDAAAGDASAAWSEMQNLTVVNGVYSATLGAGNSLEGLDYNLEYWLGISVDGAEELTPRTKLTLSPYAVIAGVSGVDNVFPQSGSVGIGTTSPASQLHVEGAIRTQVTGTLMTNVNETGIPSNDGFRIRYNGHLFGNNLDGLVFDKVDANGDYPDGGIAFANTGQDGETHISMGIRGNGTVGVGHANPRSLLHVHDGTFYVSKAFSYNATGIHTAFLMGMNQHQSNSGSNTKFLFDLEATAAGSHNRLHLRAGRVDWNGDEYAIPTAGNKTEIMTFDGSGNVGVGVTSPGSQLSLGEWNNGYAGPSTGTQLKLSGGHNSGTNIGGTKLLIEGYDNDGSTVYPIYVQDENSKVDFYLKNRPTDSSYPDAYFGGRVFVEANVYQRVDGSSQGWHKLDDESGNDKAYWYETSDVPSDVRLKTHIRPISDPLGKINRIRGVSFDWNTAAQELFTGSADEIIAGPEATEEENRVLREKYRNQLAEKFAGKSIGVIAQEIQEVLPEVVHEKENGYLEVQYGNLVALLIEAVKEQQKVIDNQNVRLAQMETTLEMIQMELTSREDSDSAGDSFSLKTSGKIEVTR